jgi:hypothetical protein
MSYLEYYTEEKKEDIKKKWKILVFLEDRDFEKETFSPSKSNSNKEKK